MNRRPRTWLLLGVSLATAATTFGQPAPVSQDQLAVDIDSGALFAQPASVNDASPRIVFSEVVHVPDAPWLRLKFGESRLAGSRLAGTQAIVRITSFLDGAEQHLDAQTLREWHNTSAYFNGDAILVEVLVSPGAPESRVIIESVWAGTSGLAGRNICGPVDDRVPFDDRRVGRLLPGGCTGFIIDDCCNHCMLTAGHCAGDSNNVVEFNVPPSTSTGALVHPHPDDQYSIDFGSMVSANNGIGDDWSYFGVFPNSNTGLPPFAAQGDAFALRQAALAPDGGTLQITGFGVDDGERNQASQTELGTYDSGSGTVIEYGSLDTESGVSGSPIFYWPTQDVIGIHTTGGCNPLFGVNSGTAAWNTTLRVYLADPVGICAGPVFNEAISRAVTVARNDVVLREAISRPITVARNDVVFREAISRAVTVARGCVVDLDLSGTVEVFDLLAYLSAWFEQDPIAEFTGDHPPAVNVFDLLAFLDIWFPASAGSPCP